MCIEDRENCPDRFFKFLQQMRNEIVFWEGYSDRHDEMIGVHSRKHVDESKI
jgi:hypothetical protein